MAGFSQTWQGMLLFQNHLVTNEALKRLLRLNSAGSGQAWPSQCDLRLATKLHTCLARQRIVSSASLVCRLKWKQDGLSKARSVSLSDE